MNRPTSAMAASPADVWWWTMLAGGLAAGLVLSTSARAAAPQVPWECSNYGEEAQARCLNAFIEHQREQIDKLEGQLQAQRETVGQLRGQIDRQAAATSDLQQQLSQRPATQVVPAPYPYTYAYPPAVGLGLYLGRPWIYGFPYSYHPFWGPRFYGRWGHRW